MSVACSMLYLMCVGVSLGEKDILGFIRFMSSLSSKFSTVAAPCVTSLDHLRLAMHQAFLYASLLSPINAYIRNSLVCN
ncbi:hypothetical protein L1987_03043 [Smallanthus sonchifolius]|uniref:Uncharacterized protein n=1 Tax=Smallanthus sonchifolius TaxID=185202 RepID=A0ACB9K9E1_9ASTR|nr:hypothetical protein L1987_03043 [Smallanthus sonchifolius]